MLRKLAEIRLVRYLVVGGVAYVIEMGSLYGVKHLGVGDVIAVAISFWVGLLVAFILQKYLAFRDNQKHPKTLALQFLFYLGLVLFNYTVNLVVVSAFSSVVSVYLLRTLLIGLATIWNYGAYKLIFSTNVQKTS